MKKILTAVLATISFGASAADYSYFNELAMANESGGEIVVSNDKCEDSIAIAKGFTNYAYATEGNGTVHKGCWVSPSTEDAPQLEHVQIIPLVNMYFEGTIVSFPQYMFAPRDADIAKVKDMTY